MATDPLKEGGGRTITMEKSTSRGPLKYTLEGILPLLLLIILMIFQKPKPNA